jgi:mitochondrial Rho GTPase 1
MFHRSKTRKILGSTRSECSFSEMVSTKLHNTFPEGVGKTSIIVTLISETFPRQVQSTFHPVTISPDQFLLPSNVYTQLIDTSSSKLEEQNTDSQIEKADVIILVYDVNNHDCKKRLKTHWMPRISKINDKVPVIFLGNKVDLRSSNADNGMTTMLNHTFPEYVQV